MHKIYLSPPEILPEDYNVMKLVLDSGWIAPVGPEIEKFEKAISKLIGIKNACAVNSGTSALHLALMSIGVTEGDVIICPTLTFAGCAFPIKYCGASPVFIDSEEDTWNMDPVLLEEAIIDLRREGRLPKAVIVVHIYGQCAKLDIISEICKKYKILLIEDVAESIGASYQDRQAGSFGDLAFFSFNGNKIITTSGGGMLISNKKKFIEKARYLSQQAREPVLHYEHNNIGFNYRMSNVLAALGNSQLSDLERRIKCRKQNYDDYKDSLKNIEGISFMPIYPLGVPNYWLTCILLNPNIINVDRNILIANLNKELIEARPTWKPLHQQPIFNSSRIYNKRVAEKLYLNGLCLPSGSNLTKEHKNKVISVLKNSIK